MLEIKMAWFSQQMPEEDKTSKYNAGLFQIQRISWLKNKAHTFAEKEDWLNYEKILDRIWVELAPDCKDRQPIIDAKKNIQEIKKMRTGFNPDKIEQEELSEHPKIFKKVKQKNKLLKEALEHYDIELRVIENALGMGVAYRSFSDEGLE